MGEEEEPATATETAAKSPLEKALGELTEEDLAQVTREDCRRFLKRKGMRRPSWNKSQAIQQVISLKALLEPAVASILSESRSDVHLPPITTEIFSRSDEKPCHSREGELTIFYDGKINVYEGITYEKAQAILQVAGSRSCFNVAPTSSSRPPKYQQQNSPNESQQPLFRDGMEEFVSHRETDPEGPASRAASLQRYLEKRKDRFRSKKVTAVPASHVDIFAQRMAEIYSASAAGPGTALRIPIDLNDIA